MYLKQKNKKRAVWSSTGDIVGWLGGARSCSVPKKEIIK